MKTLMLDQLDVELLIDGTEILQPEESEAADRQESLIQRLRECSPQGGKAAFLCGRPDLELLHDAAQTLNPNAEAAADALNALELETAALLQEYEPEGMAP